MKYKYEYIAIVKDLETQEEKVFKAFNLHELQHLIGHKLSSRQLGTTFRVNAKGHAFSSRYQITFTKSDSKVLDTRPPGTSWQYTHQKQDSLKGSEYQRSLRYKEPEIPKVPDIPEEEYNILISNYYYKLTGVPIDLQLALINNGSKPFEPLNLNEFGYGNKEVIHNGLQGNVKQMAQ